MHLNTGIVGVKYLLPALSRGGHVDVALQVAQTEEQPGWVYMVKQGATTLWETWTGTRYQPTASWNHIMFGANSEWYYKELAGIVTDGDGATGRKRNVGRRFAILTDALERPGRRAGRPGHRHCRLQARPCDIRL